MVRMTVAMMVLMSVMVRLYTMVATITYAMMRAQR